MKSVETKVNRLVIAKLDPGEDLLEALEECVKKHNIRHGFISLIGGVDKITYGVYSKEEKKYYNHEKEGFHELLGVGNVSHKDNGELFIHLHFYINNNKNEVSGGHLVKGTRVYPLAEVFIQETEYPITRSHEESTNMWPFNLK